MRALLIRPGVQTVSIEPVNGKAFTLAELYQAINCQMVEVVALNEDWVLIVDEEGRMKELPVNGPATLLSGLPLTGNVVLCEKEMFV